VARCWVSSKLLQIFPPSTTSRQTLGQKDSSGKNIAIFQLPSYLKDLLFEMSALNYDLILNFLANDMKILFHKINN
jgi:hypothetical protein